MIVCVIQHHYRILKEKMNPQQVIFKLRDLLPKSELRFIEETKVFVIDDDGSSHRVDFKIEGLTNGWVRVSYSKNHAVTNIWIDNNQFEVGRLKYLTYEEFLQKYTYFDFLKVLEEHSESK
jgi:hypothetical protein